MVVVTCTISRSIRRCPPHYVDLPFRLDIVLLMEEICRLTFAKIHSYKDTFYSYQRSYEDKFLQVRFEIVSDAVSYSQAATGLLVTFRREIAKLPKFENYMLDIQPDPNVIDSPMPVYFFDEPIKSFQIGFLSSPNEFHSYFDYQQEMYTKSGQMCKLSLELDMNKLKLDFAVSGGLTYRSIPRGRIAATTEIYRLQIDFKDMSPSILVSSTEGNAVDICFLLTAPLQLWRTQYNLTGMDHRSYEKTWWMRTCEIHSADMSVTNSFINGGNLGKCSALSLRFERFAEAETILNSLRYYSQFSLDHTVLTYHPGVAMEPAPFLNDNDISTINHETDLINWLLAALYSIGYRVQYQLTDQQNNEFMDNVRKLASSNVVNDKLHLINALNKTYDVVVNDTDRFYHLDRVLKHFLNQTREVSELASEQSRYVKRVIVTPSRVLFMAPGMMHDNRILREFDPDSSVNCSFQNDDMTRFGGLTNNFEFADDVVGKFIREGVHVANRHYEFLGCSGSQLRQNGCWLYATDSKGNTAAQIRTWMGTLDGIRNPGTYLSRMGQCFSDTTAVELESDIDINWDHPDKEGGADTAGEPYCFSDGVGCISEECLNEVFPDPLNRPSAFQVRLGGAKGMLTFDPNLKGKKIQIRKSMLKFECQHRKVEVMRRSQPTPLFLNCQVITLLSQIHQGIPDQVFIRLMHDMLHRLADTLLDEGKALVALCQSGFPCCYSKLHKAGLNFTTDPFFKGVLKAITCARISKVKCRARIEIPQEYGRAMLGVMDEEGVLEYGQVYFQYSADFKQPLKNIIVHKGPVVISKMPCLHPGDVRRLEAVDHPKLKHLVNCIVFPQKGPRPHPNEMAGSDLDGDEYFVCWHPDLIFEGDNHTPMHFPSIKKQQFDRPITVTDMAKFIVDYIMKDKVGQISNAHQSWADQLPRGIHDEMCLDLARIFCHVIDFNKTGYLPAEVTGRNIQSLLPDAYPDFMGKLDHKSSYTSSKILGKLYRISKRVEAAVSTIDKDDNEKIKDGKNWILDERFLIPGHETFITDAEKLYNMYAEMLDTEQRRYGIDSEEELVSGCVIKLRGNRSLSDSVYDVEKRLQKRMYEVRKSIKEKFEKTIELAPRNGHSTTELEEMLAAACYSITYKGKNKHRSFPWLFSDSLLGIIQKSCVPSPDAPLLQLSKSVGKIPIKDVEKFFETNKLNLPMDEDKAKVYYILLNWGQKSKFLKLEGFLPDQKNLTNEQFVNVLNTVVDDVVAEQQLDAGELLLGMIRAITSMKGGLRSEGNEPPTPGLNIMKRNILMAHHQLAREPDVTTLLVPLKQSSIPQTIDINSATWNSIKNKQGELVHTFKTKFKLRCEFRREKRGRAKLTVNGLEQDVSDFVDYWLHHYAGHTRR